VIATEILRVVEPMAIEAAREAERRHREGEAERRRIADLYLQQAEQDATLAKQRDAASDRQGFRPRGSGVPDEASRGGPLGRSAAA
jgi:hypothetical protein